MGELIKFRSCFEDDKFIGPTVKDKLQPYTYIIIKGLIPGEKLHEDLLIGKNPSSTEHPKILKVKDTFIDYDELLKKLDELKILIEQRQLEKIINFFNDLSVDFKLDNKQVDYNLAINDSN